MQFLARNVGVHCVEHHPVALNEGLTSEDITDDERLEVSSVAGDRCVRARQCSFDKGLYLFRFHVVGAGARESGLSGSAPATCNWGEQDCTSKPPIAGGAL